MDVTRFSTLPELDAERERWETIERQDRYATVFTSWRWLRAYLPVARLRWSVLVLRDGDLAVAYLPIAHGGWLFDRELYLGGNPRADYTGMIALPDYECRAVAAFAGALARQRWDAFNACDVRDPRVEAIVEQLAGDGFRLAATDETRCLSVALPATWEEYVATKISAKTRVNTLRVERRLAEALPNFRISEPGTDDLDAHIEAVVLVHHQRWGGNIASARTRFGGMFRNAYDRGLMRLFVYWDGENPIAGAAAFLDDLQSSFGLYMIGFDEAYAKLSPGKGIVGRAIRAAIESGYTRFDFLRGDEPFKQNYADEVTLTRHFRLAVPGLRAATIAYARPKLLGLKTAIANVMYRSGKAV
ncbi:MAG TPA: GNAT family N-acetyltransferase [Candidatus Elarobacter sp.]|jgi:CelD/BcsL family acetyltransferase involved in cellulose biosynthesis|nr:GNAT family N-acetyltransferase [Candidatus Elarobacter sp.]